MRRDAAPAPGTAFDLRARSAVRPGVAGKDAPNKSASGLVVPGASTEAVEVEAAAVPPSTAPSIQSSENANVIARNEMPALQNAPDITKAKPALDEFAGKAPQERPQERSMQKALPSAMVTAAASTLVKQSTSWIIADGALQRSIDGGQTWRPAMRATACLALFRKSGPGDLGRRAGGHTSSFD